MWVTCEWYVSLSRRLSKLKRMMGDWQGTVDSFGKDQKALLRDLSDKRKTIEREKQDVRQFLKTPGPMGPRGHRGLPGVGGDDGIMGPMGPLGFIGYTGQRGAVGPEGREVSCSVSCAVPVPGRSGVYAPTNPPWLAA